MQLQIRPLGDDRAVVVATVPDPTTGDGSQCDLLVGEPGTALDALTSAVTLRRKARAGRLATSTARADDGRLELRVREVGGGVLLASPGPLDADLVGRVAGRLVEHVGRAMVRDLR